ncbi:MAG: leucyl aminopeptidase [Acidobacteria bacterium]|nr:leucyl aminopeptidase [Acidobacteriota bacterium]
MDIRFERTPLAQAEAGALILLAFEDAAPVTGAACDAALAQLYSSGEYKGKPLDLVLLHAPAGLAAQRLILAGCGKLDDCKPATVRKAAGAALRLAKGKTKSVAIALTGAQQTPDLIAAATSGAILAEFEPEHHKTNGDKADKRIDSCLIAVPAATPGLETAFHHARVIAESQNFTRELVNEPGNLLPPLELAARAQAMAAEVGLNCEILDRDRMAQLGMGSLLGVAQGSAFPPALIILRYTPETASTTDHFAIVGKGVTFDTGGVSIKPSDGMEKMKYDMAGGAAAIGAMRAIAQLKPRVPVTALIPAVENHVGGRAQRPGDIVKSLNGKTIEVLNTDAEGRLILIDAITYAQRHLGVTHMIDAATLTGSIVVALGHVHVGAFSNNDEWYERVRAASQSAAESLWRMPLDDDYKKQLESPFADLQNIGTRWGGSITAAYFLKEFADPTPWVHLDIAGTAWLDDGKPWMAKGPTGICVRTFVEIAMSWR